MVGLAAWSTEIILGSLPLELECWTWVKRDKALVSCFYSTEPAVGISLPKTFPKTKATTHTKCGECKSLTVITARHLGKLMQRGQVKLWQMRVGNTVTGTHWWNTETTLISRNDTAISNAYLRIPIQLNCRNEVITTWFTSSRIR